MLPAQLTVRVPSASSFSGELGLLLLLTHVRRRCRFPGPGLLPSGSLTLREGSSNTEPTSSTSPLSVPEATISAWLQPENNETCLARLKQPRRAATTTTVSLLHACTTSKAKRKEKEKNKEER
ncbi:hypothetical protein E2C01_079086 [Portunus trituberculatus]|uniref:Uncharacterized protein n=1 Tax=Portunus trituberculatus TaxID=210409 RepID=A0A5B7IUM3_PORTR|nr:hypothetical protein [Portunus trituberculatus]